MTCMFKGICSTKECPTVKEKAKWDYLKCFRRKRRKKT